MAKIQRKNTKKQGTFDQIKKGLLTGISYIIPLVVAGGMIMSIALLIFGNAGARVEGTAGNTLRVFGGNILALMVPLLSGYIAYGISDKAALIPGIAAGVAANSINSGFLGGMISGFIAGYLVEYMKKIKYNENFAGTMNIFVYPLLGSLISGCIMLFIIGKPIALLNKFLIDWLWTIQGTNGIILGIVIGAMACFDMGGPVNKAAYAFGLAAIQAGNGVPYAAFAAAKSLPGIAITISTLFFPKYYEKEEIEAGKSAWILGCAGITECAIPYAVSDPLIVITSMMAGGAVAAAISIYGGSSLLAAGGSLLTIPVTENPLNWVIALVTGTIVAFLLLSLLKKIKYDRNHKNLAINEQIVE